WRPVARTRLSRPLRAGTARRRFPLQRASLAHSHLLTRHATTHKVQEPRFQKRENLERWNANRSHGPEGRATRVPNLWRECIQGLVEPAPPARRFMER